jgi:hypothetical protein
MPIKPLVVQKRMMELGRVRLGEKGSRGEPRKLTTFRFTSASRALLEAVAVKYGGKVREWKNAPDEGYFEVTTEAAELEIVFPPIFADTDGKPTVPFSQWMELWSGGGCQRRCDGEMEALSGKPCLCDPDKRNCQPTTRISFMLPDIPGLGVWRVESKGWNAAAETPSAVGVLVRAATEGKFIPAVLRLEQRTSKSEGQTRRFVVPTIDIPGATLNELVAGEVPLAINAPTPSPPRPAIPARVIDTPADASFADVEETPLFGTPPTIGGDSPELTDAEFRAKIKDDLIDKERVAEVGKAMFAGRSVRSLSDAERGQLMSALLTDEEFRGAPV